MPHDSANPNPVLKTAFESRAARYALAGGALMGLPAVSQASIVYSGAVNTPFTTSTPLTLNFNPLVDLIDDFTFSAVADVTKTISITPTGGNLVNMGPLTLDDPITLANTNSSGGILVEKIGLMNYAGPWAGTSQAYVGVKFTANSETFLGWAQLSVTSGIPSGVLIDYAYETLPNTEILAGKTVPEPSSLALFAAGAAGILALRRRRKPA